MNLYSQLLIIALLALNGPQAGPQTTQAGLTPGDGPPDAAMKTLVVRIDSAHPKAVEHALFETFDRLTVKAVDDTPILILRGAPEEVESAAALIEDITQINRSTGTADLRVIPLKSAPANDLAAQLRAIFAPNQLMIVPDSNQNALVARGTRDAIETLEAVVNQLDAAPRGGHTHNISLEFAFLTAGPDKPDGGLPLPEDLTNIGRELARFGTIKLMGRLKTIATPKQRFELEGMIAEKFNVRIKGRINACESDDANVEIEASAVHFPIIEQDPTKRAQPPSGAQRSAAYNLNTTVRLRMNNDLAIGIAPAGAHVGSSLVLVVRASW